MDDENEIDFDDFIDELYKNPPKDKNQIVLTLDCDNVKVLFERLMSIFHQGSIYFFGDDEKKVDLDKLTIEDFNLLNKYFNSFGIELNYKIVYDRDINIFKKFVKGDTNSLNYPEKISEKYSQDICMVDLLFYRHVDSKELYDYRMGLDVKENYYIIWFNFLK